MSRLLTCITFVILLRIYWKNMGKQKPGLLFGLFLIFVFGFRFFVEYVKEDQVAFEAGMKFNMGQLLSIPFSHCRNSITCLGIQENSGACCKEEMTRVTASC